MPMALIGTRAVLPMGGATFRSGRVTLRIGDPIPTESMISHNRRVLTDRVREQIVEFLQPAREAMPSGSSRP